MLRAHRLLQAQRSLLLQPQRAFLAGLFGGGKDPVEPASLTGQTCWVVGGVSTVGAALVAGLLDAGASVIVNSRSPARLDALREKVGDSEKLVMLQGSLLPGAAADTVQEAMGMTSNRLDHVIAHAGVRWWAGPGACDETGTLSRERLLDMSDEDFAMAAVQLPALQFSAARHLLPRLAALGEAASYTHVVGAPVDGRSALGAINVRGCRGVAAACRFEAPGCRVNEIRVDVAQAPADEGAFLGDLGAVAAGVAGRKTGAATLVVEIADGGMAGLKGDYPVEA